MSGRWLRRMMLFTCGGAAVALGVAVLGRFDDAVRLPSGFMIKRQFDSSWMGRDDFFAPDGRTMLARDVELLCFDDRFVLVVSKQQGQGGLFDAKSQRRAGIEDHPEVFETGGIKASASACGGYYSGMIGPDILYDTTHPPYPPCEWVNRRNNTLQDRQWLNRPCG